ncbi:uncharacterized protein LOC126900450 [Daktulosphaira vitifoliae]|uniref:uncharacterized protein LOC126900450 n=1 Tax=Daktulosphaira vitifoliae TaxID=58002 RepID=UPI0021A98A7D|nr:uncharacterized protein LOC126900450 [Daktulosphaira vitifoliae]
MADEFDLSLFNQFEEELGSSLRHCRNATRKLKQLTKNIVELKLNNQLEVSYKENDIDLSVKNILDDIQNIRVKVDTVETIVDTSKNTIFNLTETVQEFENIVHILLENERTIFSHRNLL